MLMILKQQTRLPITNGKHGFARYNLRPRKPQSNHFYGLCSRLPIKIIVLKNVRQKLPIQAKLQQQRTLARKARPITEAININAGQKMSRQTIQFWPDHVSTPLRRNDFSQKDAYSEGKDIQADYELDIRQILPWSSILDVFLRPYLILLQ